MKRRKFDTRHNSNQHGSSGTDMHRNFSMSGSGTRGSELGRARIGAEEDDIRSDAGQPDGATGAYRGTTINDMANNIDNPSPEDRSGREDTGSGAGGNDYVGQQTGNVVDDSIADTVAGGTSSGRTWVGAHADDATGGPSGKGDLGNAGMGRETDDADPAAAKGGPVSTTLSGESATITDEDRAAGRTGGSGAFTNDHGAHLDDIPAGTGSAQRGNRAGMEDNDEGTITDAGTR